MSLIKVIQAREILDSRGNPTIEVDVITDNNVKHTASVPSGASTGKHEVLEMRDGGKRFLGKGVREAVNNIHRRIFPILQGIDCRRQREIDNLMIELDNTKNKSRLGANGILAVSLAIAKAGAEESNMHLFQYLYHLLGVEQKVSIPRPFFNVINGGRHADNKLSIQEFMIVPRMRKYNENLRVGSEVYNILKRVLHQKYGNATTNVGDEGGFAPWQMKKAEGALDVLMVAIGRAGYKGKVDLAMDVAASEFFVKGKYLVDGKMLTGERLLEYYLRLIKKYPIISIEDPFMEDDFDGFAALRKKSRIQVVGDDLTVTNVKRIERAVQERSCNCLLLKVNQIGTLSEAFDAVKLAYENKWKVMVSHRSGETEDTFIADLAVGIGCGMIKAGAPCRGERVAKYNRLLRIGELFK